MGQRTLSTETISPPLHPSSPGSRREDPQPSAGTETWGTRHLAAVEVLQNHFLMEFLMSPPAQLLLLIILSPHHPHHHPNAQRPASLQDQVGSMGAWGEKSWEQKMETLNSSQRLGSLTNTRGLGEWEKKNEWEICDILIREREDGAADLETPAFWSQRPFFKFCSTAELFRLFFFFLFFLKLFFLCFYSLAFVFNVLASSVRVVIVVISSSWGRPERPRLKPFPFLPVTSPCWPKNGWTYSHQNLHMSIRSDRGPSRRCTVAMSTQSWLLLSSLLDTSCCIILNTFFY